MLEQLLLVLGGAEREDVGEKLDRLVNYRNGRGQRRGRLVGVDVEVDECVCVGGGGGRGEVRKQMPTLTAIPPLASNALEFRAKNSKSLQSTEPYYEKIP